MRAFIAACALVALYSSYEADAGLGDIVAETEADARRPLLNENFTLVSQPMDVDVARDLESHPRRRAVSAVSADEVQLHPRVGSDVAIHTRIQTCQGVAVTITSFGGGDWDQDMEAFCDETSNADDTSEQADAQ